MKLTRMETFHAGMQVDVLVLALPECWHDDLRVAQIDHASGGWLKETLGTGEVSSKPLATTTILNPPKLGVKQLVLVGIGSESDWDAALAFRSASTGSKTAAAKERSRVAFVGFSGRMENPIESVSSKVWRDRVLGVDLDPGLLDQSAVIGSCLGCSGQDLYRKERRLHPPAEILWEGIDSSSLERIAKIAESIQWSRHRINMPPNCMGPESFVRDVQEACVGTAIEVEIWDEKRLKEEKCEALLAVGRGSSKKPRLLILRYGMDSGKAPVALVGKGVTFDSGGLSLKPTDSMISMKCDMAGAATAVGTILSAAKIGLSTSIVCLVGLVENMIDGDCYRLGDVLQSRSGKTIEIHNTDAEGRLVLADVLDVACGLNPSCIVDFATLTGACVVALGTEIAGLMASDSNLAASLLRASERCGEFLWPLPMHRFFAEQISGQVADLKNVGEGRWGGAITAAKFLEAFVGDRRWAHIDIAGPAFADSQKPWLDAGGTGYLIRSMVDWLQTQFAD